MSDKNIAVVTGASSGIGREFVRLFAQESGIDEIWGIARHKDKLEEVRAEIGDKFRILDMDLTDRCNLERIETLLKEENSTINYLVNCAGFAKFCSYFDISRDVSLNMIDLNICALVAVTLICIPHMKDGAHIINMASQAAFQPVPYQNIYSATKAFVRSYTRALNVELKNKGICATAVCPGWMKTGLIERASIGAKRATTRFIFMKNPQLVAKKALNDAKACKDMSVYGAFVKSCHVMSKLLPQRLLMKIWLMHQHIH